MEVAWCPVSRRWEALLVQDGRTIGYGQGYTRAQAVARAVEDALRHGHRVPLGQTYVAWWSAMAMDALDYARRVIEEITR